MNFTSSPVEMITLNFNLVEIIGMMSGIATTILVIIVLIQTRQTQQQMDSTLRPWIGIIDYQIQSNKIIFQYQNFGKVPTTDMSITVIDNDSVISKKELEKSSTTIISKTGIVLPNQMKSFVPNIDEEKLTEAISNKTSYFLAVLIKWHYSNNQEGEYGTIVQYSSDANNFSVIQQWTK